MAITQTFNEFTLVGTNLQNPTSLQFGPDGRLYVSQQNGLIKVYDVEKVGDQWVASNEEVIDLVNQIPNHDDMGNLELNVNNRQVTGLVVTGTADNPILYVTSSDPRIGAGGGGQDVNLDTNSGIISRLTLNESGEWEKVDLVIGLPRSEENHSTNGMDIRIEIVEVSPGVFEEREIMYVQSGGHDNKGAPSNNFAYTPEYYYSAALLRVDLTQLAEIEADLIANGGLNGGTEYVDEYVYALPTLDDPTRTNNSAVTGDGALDSANGTTGAVDFEAADTFGGNDGRNQAKYDESGPVQVFSPGYRNAYDVVITEAGNIYTFDNGPNNNWGGDVVDVNGVEVTSETQVATNAPNLDDNTNDGDPDNLHIIQEGTYGGHPNPTRASGEAAGLWSGQGGGLSENVQLTDVSDPANDPTTVWDDLPEDWDTITGGNTNPIEGVYFGPDSSPGPQDESLLSIGSSSNGITEYTADNIGDGGAGVEYLAVVSFNGNLTLIEVQTDGTAAGSTVTDTESINVGGTPLDVTALDNGGIPGSGGVGAGAMFVAQIGANTIAILEPGDPPGVDLDADNDGVLDINDPLQFDPENGTTTVLEGGESILWDFNPASGNRPADFEYNIGFSGWMIDGVGEINPDVLTDNPTADLLTDLNNTIRGGAPGLIQIKSVTDGDAFGTNNSQNDAIQTGFTPSESVDTFTIRVPIFNPYSSVGLSENFGSVGFALGDGTQNNYLKVVAGVGGGVPRLQVYYEEGDAGVIDITVNGTQDADFNNAATGATDNSIFELYLTVDMSDPAAVTAQAFYNYELTPGGGFVLAEPKAIGEPIPLQGEVLKAVLGQKTIQDEGGNDVASSAVVTLLATSFGAQEPFEANFVDLEITSTEKQVAPVAADDETSTTPGQPVVINLADLLANDTDANVNDTLEIVSVQNATNGTAVLNDAGTPEDPGDDFVTFTPTDGFEGTATFEYTVEDSSGLTSTALVTVNVSDVEVLYRVNAGGAEIAAIDDGPNWAANTGAGAQSGEGFANNTGNLSSPGTVVFATTGDNAVPDYVPLGLFGSERWDPAAAPEMEFTFDAPTSGTYTVNLFMADGFSGTAAAGDRVFDISIEGVLVEDDLDLVATIGDQTAGMFSYEVEVTDGTLNILWEHVIENPLINAIEIIGPAAGPSLPEISILGANQTVSEGGTSVDISIASDVQIPIGEQVDVTIEIASGTATAGEDFEYTGGGTFEGGVYTHTLPIAGGSSDLTLSIDILEDLIEEGAEAFTVTITGVSANATIGTASQNVTIADNDIVVETGDVLYRVNSGGPVIAATDDGPDWSADTGDVGAAGNSPYLVSTSTGTSTYNNDSASSYAGNVASAPGVSTDVPLSLFDTERYDPAAVDPQLVYQFDVGADFGLQPGDQVEVRLYFAEIFTGVDAAGERVFDVDVDGVIPTEFDDVDAFAEAGAGNVGIVRSYTATVDADGVLDISFINGVQNPAVKGIEIVFAGEAAPDPSVVSVGEPTPASVEEQGDTGVTTLIFPVTFDVTPTAYTEVSYEVDINGTVTPGTLALGVLDGEISVDVPNDAIENGTETVTVTLTGIVEGPAVLGTASAVGEVTEDDLPVGTVVAAINAGGPALTDAITGIDYSADAFFSTPSSTFTDGNAGNGQQPALDGTAYETERFAGDLSYAIPVAPGVYNVELHFAELFQSGTGGPNGDGSGQRIFDVIVEGELVLDDYDILAETGGDINQTLIETILAIDPTTDDDDANINIQFVLDPGLDNAKVNGIVIRTADPDAYRPPADDLFGTSVEIADTGDAPSGPVLLTEGSNVMSATQEGDGDGENGVRDRDYFSITIPEGYQLSGVVLNDFQNANEISADAFLAFQQGSEVTVNPDTGENVDALQGAIIYGSEEVDGDLLALMRAGFNDPQTATTLPAFDQPLTGTWTFWLNQGAGPSTATLDFQITPYPAIEIGNALDVVEGGDDALVNDTLVFPVTATPPIEGDITINVTIDVNGVQITEDRVVTLDVNGDGSISVDIPQDGENNGSEAVTVTLNSVAGDVGQVGASNVATGAVTEDDAPPVVAGDVISAVNAGGATAIDGSAFGFTGTFETDTSAEPNALFTSFSPNQTNNSGANDAAVFVGDLPNEIFFSERWAANMEYDLALEDGTYIVELYFAETYLGLPGGGSEGGVGGRIFDVSIEGDLVIDDIDLFDEGDGIIGNGAGQAAVQIVKTFVVDVTDGNLDINFAAEVDNAKISAIIVREVVPGDTTAPTAIITADSTVTDATADIVVEVNYSDDVELDEGSIDASDVALTGAGLGAPLAAASFTQNGSQAFYTFEAPEGGWPEGDLTATVAAGSVLDVANNGVAETTATITIDLPEPILVSIGDAPTLVEDGDTGATMLVFPLALSEAAEATLDLVVEYAINGGEVQTLNLDATAFDTSGLASAMIPVPNDNINDGADAVSVELVSVSTLGYVIDGTNSTGAGSLDEDDTAPTVANAIAAQSADEDAAFSFTIPDGTFADEDGEATLTLAATLGDDTDLPTWLSFDPDTKTFSGTPENDDVDILSIKVTATDLSGQTVDASFDLTVNNTDDAPVVTLLQSELTVTGGTAANIAIATLAEASDEDPGDTATLTVTPSDPQISVADGNIVIPDNLAAGEYSIDFGATDDDGTEAIVETVSLTVTEPPVTLISISLQGGQSTSVVEELEDTLTLTVELSEAADEDITVTYQPSGTATDEDFDLAPPLQITIPAGETTGSVFLSILDDALVEVQETLTVSLTGASAGAIDVENGSISFTIDSGDTEPPVTGDPITLEAEDFTNLAESAYFAQGSSAASNNALIRLNSTERTEVSTDLPEDVTPGIYQVAITYFDENDGQSLLEAAIDGEIFGTIVMSNDGPGNAAQSANLRTIVFSGVEIDEASILSLFGTRDAGEYVRVDKVEFTRTGDIPTNQPPTGTDIQDQTVDEGADVNIVFDYTDPENDTLTIGVALASEDPLPDWLIVSDSGITGTAPAEAVGETLDLVVTIDDGNGNVVTDTFALTVNDATGPVPDVSTGGTVGNQDDLSITVTFTDATGLDPITLDPTDLLVEGPDGTPYPASSVEFDPETGIATFTVPAPEGGFPAGEYGVSMIDEAVEDTLGNSSVATAPELLIIEDTSAPLGANLDEDFDDDGTLNSLDGDIDEDGIVNADDRFAYDSTNQGIDLTAVGTFEIDLTGLEAGDSPFTAGFTGVNPTFAGIIDELDYATNNGAQIVDTPNGKRLQVESSATDTNNATSAFTFGAQTGSEFTFTGKFDNPYFDGTEAPAAFEQYGLIITVGGGDFLKLVAGSPGAAFELSGKSADVGFDGADLKVNPAGVDNTTYASVELSIDTAVTPTAITFTGSYTTYDEAGNVLSTGPIGTKTLTEGALFDALQGGGEVPAFGITHTQFGGSDDPFTVSLESMSLTDGNIDTDGPTAAILVDDIADGDSDIVVTVTFEDATGVDDATIDGDEIVLSSNDESDIIPTAQIVDNLDGTFTYTFAAPEGGWNGTAFTAALAADSVADTLGNQSAPGAPVEFGRDDVDPVTDVFDNITGVDTDGAYAGDATGSVILTIMDGVTNVRSSNFGANSFELTNTGDKQVAAVFIDVRDALYGDSVFDFDGTGGDTVAKVFQVNSETGDGTGAFFEGADSYFLAGTQPIPNTSGDGLPASGGFRGLLIKFDGTEGGFGTGELVGFSGDMDPNSLAGLSKGGTFGVDPGAIDAWDVGGVSGAELIGAKFTVLFDDGTTAEGYLHSDNSLAGSVGEAVQGRAISEVSVTVNGFDSSSSDATYGGIEPVIIVTGTPGDTVRVVMSQGFNPVTNEAGGVADIVAQRLATQHPDFQANNAFNFQTVDVVIGADGTATVPTGAFDYNDEPSNVDNPDLGISPIAVTAAVIVDSTDTGVTEKVAVGPVAEPVYLTNPTQTPVDANPPAPEGYFAGIDTGGGYRFKIQIEDPNIDNGGQNPGGDWVFLPDGESSLGDAQGTGSYYWEFLGDGNLAPNAPQQDSILTFTIFIPEGEEGAYTLRLRAGRETADPSDARNDVWVRIDGDAEALQANETDSVSNDGFIKVFGNPTGSWGFAQTIDSVSEEEPNFAAVFELGPGFHTIELAGRSPGFNIDFIELNKGGTPGVNAADSAFITTGDTAPVVNQDIADIDLETGDGLNFPIPSDAFFDADGDTLFIDVPILPEGFSFINGVLSAGPDLPVGVYPITVTATDDDLNVASQTFLVTVTEAVNDPPVANDDGAGTDINVAVAVDVLANDTDPEDDALTVDNFSQGANGAVVDLGNGVLEYTPNADFVGSDSFSYTISDVEGLESTATVNVTVTDPDAFNLIIATPLTETLVGTDAADAFVFAPGTSVNGSIDTVLNWQPG
ncbi:MAG: malectin domain-containing carbohydrate-binding protein, partial [Henriciella sp.]